METMTKDEKIFSIAKVCHQAYKTLCEINGDDSINDWGNAELWQRESAIKTIKLLMDNPKLPHHELHNIRMKEKIDDGWTYGEEKDMDAKTHPHLKPFHKLSLLEQKKDVLFCIIFEALT